MSWTKIKCDHRWDPDVPTHPCAACICSAYDALKAERLLMEDSVAEKVAAGLDSLSEQVPNANLNIAVFGIQVETTRLCARWVRAGKWRDPDGVAPEVGS